ncbi:MAG: hypothetical protein CSA81_00660 [Acidobacteria bacterium]|nr:MAG: hypothetical protein CSA81_00660 [Acidobacteriota bacterium]
MIRFIFILLLLIPFGVAQTEQEEMAKAMQEMQQAMQQMNHVAANVKVIGFRELKKMLPEKVLGIERTKAFGERNAAMGMKVSEARGEYGVRGKKPFLSLEIVDSGSLQGIVGMSMAGWSTMEIDRESDTELEQTFTYKGNKGIRNYQFEQQSGEVSVIIGSRVIVSMTFQGVSLEDFEKALDSVDIKGIEGLIASVEAREKDK